MRATRGPYLAPILIEDCHLGPRGLLGWQAAQEETLSGPDSHETALRPSQYLLGDWAGVRSYLLERGVRFHLQYISDSLSNVVSDRNARFVPGIASEEQSTSILVLG